MEVIKLFEKLIKKTVLPKYPWILNVETKIDDKASESFKKLCFIVEFHYINPTDGNLYIPGVRDLQSTVKDEIRNLWKLFGYQNESFFIIRWYKDYDL